MPQKNLTHKFVAVLNKKVPIPNLMNALGHMTAGLAANYPNFNEMRFDNYFDKKGTSHPNISDNPFIILQADNSNQIRTLRTVLKEANINPVDFISTMTVGASSEQQEITRNTFENELEYYGICFFGPIEKLSNLTKKFSLWR